MGTSDVLNAARYTGFDEDITQLTTNDQINYGYYLLDYDVNASQQMNEGMKALNDAKEPMNLLLMLKTPKKVGLLITAIAMMFVILIFVVYVCIYIYFEISGNQIKQNIMSLGIPVIIGIFLIIILLKLLYENILKEIMKAYILLPS
jgi:hypothetical protein